MGYKRYKIQTLFTFIAAMIFMLLMAISFWNVSKDKIVIGPWPLIFLILSLISIILLFLAYSKATDSKLIEEEINTQVNQTRTQILEELKTEKESEKEVDTTPETETIVNRIVPKGKFKTSSSFIKKLLSNMANEFQIVCGIYYSYNKQKKVFSMETTYALQQDAKVADFKHGENLNGQVADNKEIMIVSEIPETYFTVESGLGNATPKHLVIIPFIRDKRTTAVLEFATFMEIPVNTVEILTKVTELVVEKLKQF